MVKVIVAGFQKTGTKSLTAAFRRLGYKVYDVGETYTIMRESWINFFAGKIGIESVCEKYDSEGVDVIIDGPGNYFWEEMSNYWPKAKIILTLRDNEEKWFSSLIQFYKGSYEWCGKFMRVCHLSRRGMNTETGLTIPYHQLVFGTLRLHPLYYDIHNPLNESLMKRKYREHNIYVTNQASKERLLVFNVKEGWPRLCKFLEEAVPEEPFPHNNKGGRAGELLDDVMDEHIYKIKIEIIRNACLLILIPLTLAYFFQKHYYVE